MGKLTTHVLDTAHGCPGKGITVRLYRCGKQDTLLLKTKTNADGRCDAPLLAGKDMKTGTYRLEFDIAAYFKTKGTPFLGTVAVCFGMADAKAHYHVPLLVSPYGYSTYRGS